MRKIKIHRVPGASKGRARCSPDYASKGRAVLYLDCIWIISSLFARSMKSNCRKSLSQDKLSRLRHGPEIEFGFAGDRAWLMSGRASLRVRKDVRRCGQRVRDEQEP